MGAWRWNLNEERVLGYQNMEKEMIEFQTKERLEEGLCDRIVEIIRLAIQEKGIAKLLLSGGGTPKELYRRLSNCELDWNSVKIGLVDERFVTIDSPFSNQKMISEILLQNSAKHATLFGMVHSIENYTENVETVNKMYEELNDADLVLLGMGADGHTASIFPGDQPSIQCVQDKSAFIRNTNAPNDPKRRITVNKPFISNSKHIFLMITGDHKRQVFIQCDPEKHPIHNFKEVISEVYFTTN